MTNQHQYNPAVYTGLRLSAGAVMVATLFAASLIAFKSATGEIYNPLFRFFAWLFNSAFQRHILAYSTRELDGMAITNETNVFGDYIANLFFIVGMGCLTFYLVTETGKYLAGLISDYALKYKLGDEGAAEYKRKQAKKYRLSAEKSRAVSELEKSRRGHYEQWKKHNKSTLTYEEWKLRYPD